ERTVEASDFFVMALTTALAPDEILTEVRVPVQTPGSGWSIVEVSRRHGDFAMAGAAVTLSLAAGRVEGPRIVLFGVGAAALRAHAAEQALAGQSLDAAALRRAAEHARAAAIDPLSDLHASSEYRQHLAGVLVERALAQAVSRAGGSS
ncbi:MAG: xanthine dehydrogenase family protein subunit M, partial [Deltaproteobacteria bacterium]|nr:xanthine dehydrogenase family protein subunit M [Deltaproteobacteria bacterium]